MLMRHHEPSMCSTYCHLTQIGRRPEINRRLWNPAKTEANRIRRVLNGILALAIRNQASADIAEDC
jgi:hypothetical protein